MMKIRRQFTRLCCSCASASKLFSVLKEFDLPGLLCNKIKMKMI